MTSLENGDLALVNIAEQEETEFLSIIQKHSYHLFYLLNLLKY